MYHKIQEFANWVVKIIILQVNDIHDSFSREKRPAAVGGWPAE